jgi:hypothetical protein
MTKMRKRKYWFVNIYELDRVYGGPEEGGWYYDIGTPITGGSIRVESKGMAEIIGNALAEDVYADHKYRVSVRPNGIDYAVRVETHPPRPFPAERPHYE